jgi:hypothetical protein
VKWIARFIITPVANAQIAKSADLLEAVLSELSFG